MKKKENYILHFLKSTGLLFIGVVLPKVVVFLLLSFNTSHISTAEYGYYDLTINISTLLSYLLYFDIWITTMRFLCDQDYDHDKGSVIKSGNRIFLLSTAIFITISALICILTKPEYGIDVIILGISQNLTNMYTFSARGLGNDRDFALSGILGSIALGLLNIVFISYAHWTLKALYWSAIIGYFVQCIYLETKTGYLKIVFTSPLQSDIAQKMFRFTLPMGIGALAFWVLNSFDKIVLAYVLNLDAGGIYAVAEKLSGMITFAVQCFTYAWQDIAFRHESDDEGSFYSLATSLYLVFLSSGISLLLPCIRAIFPFIIGEAFSDASMIIPVTISAAAISGLSLFLNNIFYAIHETNASTKLSLISCVFNLVICYPCIKQFGMIGASIAIICSFGADFILKSIYLNRKNQFHISRIALLVSILLILVSCFVYYKSSLLVNCIWLVFCIIVIACFGYKYLIKNK